MTDIIDFVMGSPVALAIILAGLIALGLYGNHRRRRERREDLRRAL